MFVGMSWSNARSGKEDDLVAAAQEHARALRQQPSCVAAYVLRERGTSAQVSIAIFRSEDEFNRAMEATGRLSQGTTSSDCGTSRPPSGCSTSSEFIREVAEPALGAATLPPFRKSRTSVTARAPALSWRDRKGSVLVLKRNRSRPTWECSRRHLNPCHSFHRTVLQSSDLNST